MPCRRLSSSSRRENVNISNEQSQSGDADLEDSEEAAAVPEDVLELLNPTQHVTFAHRHGHIHVLKSTSSHSDSIVKYIMVDCSGHVPVPKSASHNISIVTLSLWYFVILIQKLHFLKSLSCSRCFINLCFQLAISLMKVIPDVLKLS